MATKETEQNRPQPQTVTNPSGEPIGNPFKNKRSADQDLAQAGEDLEKEQQFKEAQTERD